MKNESTCQPFIEKLVDGVQPSSDAELSAHLTSCLDCYRTSQSLAQLDVETLRAQLQPEAQDVPEDNDLFWAALQKRIVDEWQDGAGDTEKKPAQKPAHRHQQRAVIGGSIAVALAAAAALILTLGQPKQNQQTMQANMAPAPTENSTFLPIDDLQPVPEVEALGESALDVLSQLLSDEIAAEDADMEFLHAPVDESYDPVTGFTASESLFLLDGEELAVLSQDLATGYASSGEF